MNVNLNSLLSKRRTIQLIKERENAILTNKETRRKLRQNTVKNIIIENIMACDWQNYLMIVHFLFFFQHNIDSINLIQLRFNFKIFDDKCFQNVTTL